MRLAPALGLLLLLTHPLAAQATHDTIPPRSAVRWPHLLAAGVAVAFATTFDAPIAQRIGAEPAPGLRGTTREFHRFGEVQVLVPVVGGLALVGALADAPAASRTARELAMSVGFATVAVSAGKYLLGRDRPYETANLGGGAWRPLGGSTALPSGHTAAAFAMATTLADAVDHPLADVGFYALAGGTGLARMVDQKHWFSDVVAGAVIGTISAKLANGHLRVFGLAVPRVVPGAGGTTLAWQATLPRVR